MSNAPPPYHAAAPYPAKAAYLPTAGYAPTAAYPPRAGVATTSTTVVTQPAVVVARAPGSCPQCGGYISEDFTACGIICAICFFPIGLLCCLLMRDRRCQGCGRMF